MDLLAKVHDWFSTSKVRALQFESEDAKVAAPEVLDYLEVVLERDPSGHPWRILRLQVEDGKLYISGRAGDDLLIQPDGTRQIIVSSVPRGILDLLVPTAELLPAAMDAYNRKLEV